MRVDDYDWKGLSPDLVEWLDDVTQLLNTGKYALYYYGTTTPSATSLGQQGESMIGKDGVNWYLYIYRDDTDKWGKTQLTDV